MKGYQFGHIETWSRKGGTTLDGEATKTRRNGQRAWSVEEIIEEAERHPFASQHVAFSQQSPRIIAGTCSDFSELRIRHEVACEVKTATPYTNKKTGKKSTRLRKVRADAHTLYAAVFSLPIDSADALEDPRLMDEAMQAIDAVIGFERERLANAGGELAMSVVHLDEEKIHVHVFGLDLKRGCVNNLHPGKSAVEKTRRNAGWSNLPVKTLNRRYCNAMRDWQDDLHDEVFSKFGLLRFGPRRDRLSREEYQQQKDSQQEISESDQKLSYLREAISLAETRLDLLTQHAADVSRMSKQGEAKYARADALLEATELKHAAAERDRTAAELQRKENEITSAELDAKLATLEAMADGTIEVEERDGKKVVAVSRSAHEDENRTRVLARMSKSPKAAREFAVQLSKPLERLKARTVQRAKEDMERWAQQEYASLNLLRQTYGKVYHVAKKWLRKIPGDVERSEANSELDAAYQGAVRTKVSEEREQRMAQQEGRKRDDDQR